MSSIPFEAQVTCLVCVCIYYILKSHTNIALWARWGFQNKFGENTYQFYSYENNESWSTTSTVNKRIIILIIELQNWQRTNYSKEVHGELSSVFCCLHFCLKLTSTQESRLFFACVSPLTKFNKYPNITHFSFLLSCGDLCTFFFVITENTLPEVLNHHRQTISKSHFRFPTK